VTSARVRHPILRLEVLGSDGKSTSEHRVFCQLERESVQVETCCACVHCDAITEGPAPSVECSLPVRPLEPADDPTGESMEVGTMLCRGTVVLAASTTLRCAVRLLNEENRRSVAVVDENGVLVGLVYATRFLNALDPARTAVVSATMSTPIAVDESTPVRVALRLLAANHLREATVISRDGVPIGVFRDVDGLRWIARARDAARGE
jgi:predicted transcriptional regulator